MDVRSSFETERGADFRGCFYVETRATSHMASCQIVIVTTLTAQCVVAFTAAIASKSAMSQKLTNCKVEATGTIKISKVVAAMACPLFFFDV